MTRVRRDTHLPYYTENPRKNLHLLGKLTFPSNASALLGKVVIVPQFRLRKSSSLNRKYLIFRESDKTRKKSAEREAEVAFSNFQKNKFSNFKSFDFLRPENSKDANNFNTNFY